MVACFGVFGGAKFNILVTTKSCKSHTQTTRYDLAASPSPNRPRAWSRCRHHCTQLPPLNLTASWTENGTVYQSIINSTRSWLFVTVRVIAITVIMRQMRQGLIGCAKDWTISNKSTTYTMHTYKTAANWSTATLTLQTIIIYLHCYVTDNK